VNAYTNSPWALLEGGNKIATGQKLKACPLPGWKITLNEVNSVARKVINPQGPTKMLFFCTSFIESSTLYADRISDQVHEVSSVLHCQTQALMRISVFLSMSSTGFILGRDRNHLQKSFALRPALYSRRHLLRAYFFLLLKAIPAT
jgi:hypothetical protein